MSTISEIRLECVRLAVQERAKGDRRPILTIADELFAWITQNGGAPKKADDKDTLTSNLQSELSFLSDEPNSRPKTIKDMVRVILRERYPRGLTALEILAAIHERWMPDLERTSLSPQLSRLKWNDEIVNEYGRWKLVKDGAPSADPDGAPKNSWG